ncbi:MAG: hypothetical protein RQM92_02835 [Candidatus Syntrophopropionicum ammoniitolerans]
MPVYNYPAVYIENLANLKASLTITDRISCRVYDVNGTITNRCRNGLYDLVVGQDIVYGDPRVDLAIHETAGAAGTPGFMLSHGPSVRMYAAYIMTTRSLITPGPRINGRKRRFCSSGG